MTVDHNRGGVFIGEMLFILYQYFRFVHIMPSAPPGYAQGYAVGRHYHAVLRGRIVAEDDGTEGLVHSSNIIKNTSLQSVRAMMEIAMF